MTQTATLKTAVSPAKSPASPPAQTYDELFERGDYYTVVNGVLPLVGSGPTGLHAAMLACKSYVALGLIDAAREIITHPTSPLSQMPEFQSLLPRLTEIPGSKISWATLTDRFEKNLSTLLSRHPHLAVHESTFRGIPDWLELHRCRDGNLQVMQRDGAAQGRWLPGLLDLRRLSAEIAIPNEGKQLTCPPYLITGDHFGCLFKRVFDSSNRLFLTYSPWIYLIEPDPASLGLCLYTEESVDKWCHDRVIIHAGPRCVEDFAATCRANLERCLPDSCLHTPFAHRPVLDNLIAAIQTINREHGEALTATVKSAHAHYDELPPDHWASRYAPGSFAGVSKPLRVLGITSRFTTVLQYSMRDLKAAFERAGHTFDLLIEPTDADQHTQLAMARAVEKSRPDLIFLIDHHRHEYGSLFPQSVPYVCWIQDMLPNLVSAAVGQKLGARDYYVCGELDELVRHFCYPASQGMAWTAATSELTYSSEPLPDSVLSHQRCDFSYVSNQSQLPEDFHKDAIRRMANNKPGETLFNCIFDWVRRDMEECPRQAIGRPATTILAQASKDSGITPGSAHIETSIRRFYIHPLMELLFRQQALDWVAAYCERSGRQLQIYGHGWENHPRFARFARGVAESGEQLRAIYQASAINLQIIGSGAIHPRLLDGLASGGFFMIRRTPFDCLQNLVLRLLSVVDRCGITADTTYQENQQPEFASALRELHEFETGWPGPEAVSIQAPQLARYREMEQSGFHRNAAAMFPDYEEVAFDSAESLAQRADFLLSDPPRRRSLADSFHSVAVKRYTYSAFVSDLVNFLAQNVGSKC
ncbi:hypothetical protein B7486_08445 [cyanobacterium TDX16]|nr:hypothetical protein B7486_08445 [cyanobacterium TDX16]